MAIINVTCFKLQIQNEGYQLQLGAKDALLNALLLAVQRFSSGPPQVHCFSYFYNSVGVLFSREVIYVDIFICLIDGFVLTVVLFKIGSLLLSWQLLTQICLALSALILQVVAHGNPIEQLFYSLQNLQSQDGGNMAVLEMLTVLPEEVVDSQRIDSKMSSLHKSHYTQEVLELLL